MTASGAKRTYAMKLGISASGRTDAFVEASANARYLRIPAVPEPD
jgi:tRNA U38,U39,U40 pseudouridine synthase TruA